jgi:hypothetical protein
MLNKVVMKTTEVTNLGWTSYSVASTVVNTAVGMAACNTAA